MAQAQKTNQGPKKFNPKSDSFLEALRGIGSDATNSFKNDLVKKGAKDIFDSFSPFQPSGGESKPNQPQMDNENFFEQKYQQQRRQLENGKREERVLFTRQDRETQTQVKSLQEEIKKLATNMTELTREVQVATMNEQVNPGTYHVNFLEKLYSVIKALRMQVQESSIWLSSWNKRSKKKNSYWNQFKKSGSSFSLHHDRSVATQAG